MKYFYIIFFTIILNASDDRALLFNGNCTTCHFPHETISAPSMADVKKRYKETFLTREDFIDYMSKWVAKPSKDNSLMLDAIEKHSLMPELGFEESVLREITSYIYDKDF